MDADLADFSRYSGMKICVALSGGEDSMALCCALLECAKELDISVCAVNCDHSMRETSERDSKFVKSFCDKAGVPLISFKSETGFSDEAAARAWRTSCYFEAAKNFCADAVATAHHMRDNAETVLFNISRGGGISGAAGIREESVIERDGEKLRIVRPLLCVPKEDIDTYVQENDIPYVVDETNFEPSHTRNRIRLEVIPDLEDAVPGAVSSIYRFSRVCEDTERYFNDLIAREGIFSVSGETAFIKDTKEFAIFSRAVLKVYSHFHVKDYTSEHIKTLYSLQDAECGKMFEAERIEFRKEAGGISARRSEKKPDISMYFSDLYSAQAFDGQRIIITGNPAEVPEGLKALRFDLKKIPIGSVARHRQKGDVFCKFGGGTKNFAEYLTDKKIPKRVKDEIVVVAYGSEVLIAAGLEISEKVKVDENSDVFILACEDVKNKIF